MIFEEGSSLRHIGFAAFGGCPLIEEMNLPASLETLGGWALYGCKGLKKVTLSPKITTIEELALGAKIEKTNFADLERVQSTQAVLFLGLSVSDHEVLDR